MTRKWARFDSQTLSALAGEINLTDQLTGESGKEHSQFISHQFAVGGTIQPRQQYNGDTATNYAARVALDGGIDFLATNLVEINWDLLGVQTADSMVNQTTINLSAQEKLLSGGSVGNNGNGAGNVPNRRENAYKWVNTSAQINASRLFDSAGTGNLDTDSNFTGFMPIDQAIARFASMREAFNPLTAEFKQHFQEWFSGATLPSIWTFAGPGTSNMVDAINEGYQMSVGTGTISTAFNNDGRSFDFLNSVCIWLGKRITTTNQNITYGMSDVSPGQASANAWSIGSQTTTSTAFWVIATRDGSSSTLTITSVPVNNIFNSFKGELVGATLETTINGFLSNTVAATLPTAGMQPLFFVNGVGKTGRARYCEAFNK